MYPGRTYDYSTLYDPLVAPRRRDDYNLPFPAISTRGYSAPYKKVGYLIDKNAENKDKYKILLLMGRQKYPNSTIYQYYATEKALPSGLKFELDRTQEFQSDDTVTISNLGKTYTVAVDKLLDYEYNPYLY